MPPEVFASIKSIFVIASNFAHNRDWRDVFGDLMSEVGYMCIVSGSSSASLSLLTPRWFALSSSGLLASKSLRHAVLFSRYHLLCLALLLLIFAFIP